MDASLFLQLAGPVLGIAGAAVSGVFATRVTKTEYRLNTEREETLTATRREDAAEAYFRDVVNLAQEPFLYAASDLQSRIYNLVEGNFISAYAGSDKLRHRTNITEYTAFLFAQYFGWAEAMRQGVLLSEVARRSPVQGAITDASSSTDVIRRVSATLRDDQYGRVFLLFSGEQHAIGEMMLSWQIVNGIRVPSVERYASFARRYRTNQEFREWFEPIDEGMLRTADAAVRERLAAVQNCLVDLVETLDPDGRIYDQRKRIVARPDTSSSPPQPAAPTWPAVVGPAKPSAPAAQHNQRASSEQPT